jgi:electron transport complex protein RnfE
MPLVEGEGLMPLVFILAPGGFIVLGYLMVMFNKIAKR